MGRFSEQLKSAAKNAQDMANALERTGGVGGAPGAAPSDPAAPAGGLTVQFNTTITEFGNASTGGGSAGGASISDTILRFNRLADLRQKQLLDALRRSKDGIYVGIRSGEAG